MQPHLHAVIGRGGYLGPDVVDKVLRQAAVFVQQGDKWRHEQHGGEERQREDCGRCVKDKGLQRGKDACQLARGLL